MDTNNQTVISITSSLTRIEQKMTDLDTRLFNTESGVMTPQTIVNYLQIDIGGTKYWIPLVQ